MKNYTLIPNEIFEESQLSVPARYLLCVLLRYCGQKEWCYPSQKTLGKKLGYSARYIRKLLGELETANLIQRKRLGFNRPNNYKVAREYTSSRKRGDYQLGSSMPIHQGRSIPPKNTYIKTKGNITRERFREKMEAKGVFKVSEIFLEGKL